MEFQRVIIVDILSKFIDGPLFLTISFYKTEFADWITIESSFISFDHEVVAVDSYGSIIVRDGKGEDLSVQLFLTLYRSKKFDKSFYGDGYTIRVLAIGNIESGSAALYLVDKKGKVYSVGRDK